MVLMAWSSGQGITLLFLVGGQKPLVPLLLLGLPFFPIILFGSTTLLTGKTSLNLQWPLTSQLHGSVSQRKQLVFFVTDQTPRPNTLLFIVQFQVPSLSQLATGSPQRGRPCHPADHWQLVREDPEQRFLGIMYVHKYCGLDSHRAQGFRPE
jgi:hypothetical protein